MSDSIISDSIVSDSIVSDSIIQLPLGRRGLLLGSAALAGTLLVPRPASAQLKIDITRGNVQPMPIAVADFLGGSGGDADMAGKLTGIVENNLKRSGLFAPIPRSSFTEKISNFDGVPNFDAWKVINAQALVTGRVTRMPDGRLRAEFRLWDVLGAKQDAGSQFVTTAENWRRLAHIISDQVYGKITGEKGYFDTRVVFVDEQGPKDKRVKRLAIMDQDGANLRYLSRGDDLVITPRFSPTSQEITYMSFGKSEPRVYLLNIENGQREVVGNFPGMTFSPRFSPDGQRIVMSLQQQSAANLYVMDLRSKSTTRLTDGTSIDTGPSFAPDNSRLVFESDRGGTQQLYVMSATGGGANRISFGEGRYSTPVWSPRGDFIAFTRQRGGQFAIGVMKPDGSGERILTEGFHNEGPTWAPNGSYVMFFRDAGAGPKIYQIHVSGRAEFQVPTPAFASDPAWSPLLSDRAA